MKAPFEIVDELHCHRSSPTWDILICSIEHRTGMLTDLLAELKRQKIPGFGVRVFRDNLETEYGTKCQRLLESSTADYVSFLDDDDWVVEDFVKTIMKTLREQQPDYVGFRVLYTEDGNPQLPVIHSLQYGGWQNQPDVLIRDIVHFNPIRRDLAARSFWEGGDGADARWAGRLRELGCVKTEVFIDREMHHYRHRSWDTFTASSVQQPMTDRPARPNARWVTWLEI